MKRIFALILAFALLLPGLALAEGETPPASPVAEPTPDAEPTASPPPSAPPQSAEPAGTPESTPVVDQLIIDSWNLYDGMDKTYQQGYVPRIVNGRAYIILPLLGKTYDGKVTVTADLGATASDIPWSSSTINILFFMQPTSVDKSSLPHTRFYQRHIFRSSIS